MFAVAWRHNANSPWNLLKDIQPSEQDARAEINKYGKYDMAKREYRIIPIGDADTWHDPVAEQRTFMGMRVVVDSSMPDGVIKVGYPNKADDQ